MNESESSFSSSYYWNGINPSTNTTTTTASSSSNTNTTASLQITILSVYDLPYREPPSYVQLTLHLPSNSSSSSNASSSSTNISSSSSSSKKVIRVRTGPPTQRHRDRNSFKFSPTSPTTSNSTTNEKESSVSSSCYSRLLTITHSNLTELYNSILTFEVIYKSTTTTSSSSSNTSSNNNNNNNNKYHTTTTITSLCNNNHINKPFKVSQHCHINETKWEIIQLSNIPISTSYMSTTSSTGINSNNNNNDTSYTTIVQHSPRITSSTTKTTQTPSKISRNRNHSYETITSTSTYNNNNIDTNDLDDEDDDTTIILPTLRIQMIITGPYRIEISTLLYYCNLYIQCIDIIENYILYNPISKYINTTILIPIQNYYINQHNNNNNKNKNIMKWIIISIISITIIFFFVFFIPILTGITIITLPLMIPILLLLFLITNFILFWCILFYCSSERIFGTRQYMYITYLLPIIQTILSSNIGQHLIYDIGSRYAPFILLCYEYHLIPTQNTLYKLYYAILLDSIGSMSYILPGIGELFDIIYAPIQTILIMALYNTDMNMNNNDNYVYYINNDSTSNPNTPPQRTISSTSLSLSSYDDNNNNNDDNNNNSNSNNYNTKIRSITNHILDIISYISFIEEILPFTDFIPTATIGWVCIYGIVPLLYNNNNNNTNNNNKNTTKIE